MGVARSVVLPLTRRALPAALSTPAGLWLINTLHRRLTLAGKRRFFPAFGEMEHPVTRGWRLDFPRPAILLPLPREVPPSGEGATPVFCWGPEGPPVFQEPLGPRPPP